MPIWEHLEELRWVILKSLIVLVITTGLGLAFTNTLYDILQRPLAKLGDSVQLVYTAPLDAIMVKLKLGLLGGCVLAFPFVMYFVWAFVRPGLKSNERQAAWVSIGSGLVFLCVGMAFGYRLLPFCLPILASFAQPGVSNLWSFKFYINFCFRLLLGCGAIFELPVVLTVLVRFGIVSADRLAKSRPYAIVLALFVAAVLTPPDPISQAALALPIVILYELSIISGRWQERILRRKQAEPDPE